MGGCSQGCNTCLGESWGVLDLVTGNMEPSRTSGFIPSGPCLLSQLFTRLCSGSASSGCACSHVLLLRRSPWIEQLKEAAYKSEQKHGVGSEKPPFRGRSWHVLVAGTAWSSWRGSGSGSASCGSSRRSSGSRRSGSGVRKSGARSGRPAGKVRLRRVLGARAVGRGGPVSGGPVPRAVELHPRIRHTPGA